MRGQPRAAVGGPVRAVPAPHRSEPRRPLVRGALAGGDALHHQLLMTCPGGLCFIVAAMPRALQRQRVCVCAEISYFAAVSRGVRQEEQANDRVFRRQAEDEGRTC